MKIKVVSDGTQMGTRVLAVGDDGAEHRLDYVTDVRMQVSAQHVSASIAFDSVSLELRGDFTPDGSDSHRTLASTIDFEAAYSITQRLKNECECRHGCGGGGIYRCKLEIVRSWIAEREYWLKQRKR